MAGETGGNPGLSQLAQVLSQRAGKEGQAADRPLVLEIGMVNTDMSLTANSFSKPIPKSDYHVCRQLTLGAAGGYLTGTGSEYVYDHYHNHSVLIPEKMRSIQPGDRVLIAWIDTEVVIIDIITKL